MRGKPDRAEAAGAPRSLAEQLRGWDDRRLARLFADRPDLTTPAPHDFGQLASRATVRASLSRALDTLTLLELSVLDALVVAGQTTPAELTRIVAADDTVVTRSLQVLLDLCLAWEPPGGLRAVVGVPDALGHGPGTSGLLPRSPSPRPIADVVTDVAVEIEALSEPARALLAHVVESGGEADPGRARRTVLPAEATSPAEELLARHLLVARGNDDRVVAPGEVGLALRGGRTTTDPAGVLPEPATADRDAATVDRVAAGAALEATRRVELLLDRWGAQPPPVLRSGGLGVRELRATATHLLVEDAGGALLIEVAGAAGLLASRADARGAPAWVPTDAFDTWTALPPAERWAVLARAWLTTHRTPSLVGTRDPAGKGLNALSPDLSSPWVAETRRMTLTALAELPPGTTLATGTGTASVVARVEALRPRRPRSRAEHVSHALAEAAELGLTGLGGLAAHGRALLLPDPAAAAAALSPLVPPPVEQVIIQADLTAVAPGPLAGPLARRLAMLADVESRGGATTYRFTSASVRRALDAGWSAVEVHDFLAEVSRTPVPQPLTYLVDDTVRTFGTVRVGHAEAFLRADDEAALTELLHHPQAHGLELRRIAPTVLISSTPVDVLLPRLRELGAAPVVEAPDGTVQVSRPEQLRARTPRDRRDPATQTRLEAHETARISSVVAAVRTGDRVAAAPQVSSPSLTPSGALNALREALERGGTVVIGYVDNQGVSGERIVDPVALGSGSLTALDHRAGTERTFAVHRITTVRPAAI